MENKELTKLSESERVLSPSLKLVRNSKGYTWEIRILEIDIKRLEEINNEMLSKFGSFAE